MRRIQQNSVQRSNDVFHFVEIDQCEIRLTNGETILGCRGNVDAGTLWREIERQNYSILSAICGDRQESRERKFLRSAEERCLYLVCSTNIIKHVPGRWAEFLLAVADLTKRLQLFNDESSEAVLYNSSHLAAGSMVKVELENDVIVNGRIRSIGENYDMKQGVLFRVELVPSMDNIRNPLVSSRMEAYSKDLLVPVSRLRFPRRENDRFVQRPPLEVSSTIPVSVDAGRRFQEQSAADSQLRTKDSLKTRDADSSTDKNRLDEQPLSVGERVAYFMDNCRNPEYGVVRWLGTIEGCPDEMVGVEFDNPIGNGSGQLNGRCLFYARLNHAAVVPMGSLIRADDAKRSRLSSTDSTDYPVAQKRYSLSERRHQNQPSVTVGNLVSIGDDDISCTVSSSTEDCPFKIDSIVEVTLTNQRNIRKRFYGTVKWIGCLATRKEQMAAIDLDNELPAEFSDGKNDLSSSEYWFLPGASRRSVFVQLSSLRPMNDKKIDSVLTSSKDLSIADMNINASDDVLAKPWTVSDLRRVIGKPKGIQGKLNSCYLDATLFALFATTAAFDDVLWRPARNRAEIKLHEDIRHLLRVEIVDPLRRQCYVGSDKIMELRRLLDIALPHIQGLTSAEKDPEELINGLFTTVFQTPSNIYLNTNQSSFLCQLIIDDSMEKTALTSVQSLLERSFFCSDVMLTKVPERFIVQLPRYGKQKLYDFIVPTLRLNISNILSGRPKRCGHCNTLATYQCRECYLTHISDYSLTFFCVNCFFQFHDALRKHKDHRPTELSQHVNVLPYEDTFLVLSAVICIESSHYVSFARVRDNGNPEWLFFDSMADRTGGSITGYNLPEIVVCQGLDNMLNADNRDMLVDALPLLHANDANRAVSSALSPVAERLFRDCYICVYALETDCAKMVTYEIENVTVDFPYEAYPSQLKYMERVIAALNRGWNGALESPTGTGKTLCLLCSCLAWQQQRKQQFIGLANENHIKMSSNSQPHGFLVPKIIYTSRTHMQLSQVVRELNKTVYKRVKTCVLASRDQLCVNDEVKAEQNTSIKNHLCRAKVKARTCQYYIGYESNSKNSLQKPTSEHNGGNGSALDIEDFLSFGRRKKVCPFYTTRDDQENAELIFAPYNYILDSMARKANKIDLGGSILIFDEAHNLEKVCEDSASFSFSTKDLAGCLREGREALKATLDDQETYKKDADQMSAALANIEPSTQDTSLNANDLAHFIVLLENVEREIDSVDLSQKSDLSLPGTLLDGEFLANLLQRAGISANFSDDLCTFIEKVTSYLTERAQNNVWQSRGVFLQKFSTLLRTVFVVDKGALFPKTDNQNRYFKLYISADDNDTTKRATLEYAIKTPRKAGVLLNHWCFSASVSMKSLQSNGVYSILLTSGTLSPMNYFISEMSIPFQLTLQNDHVIEPHQVWFGIVCNGPDGCKLNASYGNRDNDSYINSLGNVLVNVFRLTGQGCLVFFASYSQMNVCVDRWQTRNNGHIWKQLSSLKTLFVEPKSKDKFHESIKTYNELVKTKGAAFFAVCRGKVSEGIDFADSAGRAVIMVGIPYPPVQDPKVILKKSFLQTEQRLKAEGTKQTNVGDSGSEWYTMEAVRAVNQAIGRVIRHKNDYGAIIMADQRFAGWKRENFPVWIGASGGKPYENFGDAAKSLALFFKRFNSAKVDIESNRPSFFESTFKQKSNDGANAIEHKRLKLAPENEGKLVDFYSSSNDSAKTTKSAASDLWQALGEQDPRRSDVSEQHETETSQPSALNQSENQSIRRRIRIKQQPSNDVQQSQPQLDAGTTTGGGALRQKCEPYIELARRKLGRDEFQRFGTLVKTYKTRGDFRPVFDYLKALDYAQFADVIEGFTIFVREENKVEYLQHVQTVKTL